MDTPQTSPAPYTPPVTSAPPAPTPVQTPPPTGSHMGMLLGILAGVVVLAAAAYYFLVMKGDDVAVVSPSPSASAEPTLSPTATTSPTTTTVPTGWKNFSSQYFTLSFAVPSQFTIQDSLDSVVVRGGVPGTAALDVRRYGGTYTKASAQSNFRESHSDVISSTAVIDGSTFTRLDGISVDGARLQSLIFFEQSAVLLSADTTGQTQNDLAVPNQILSTFKFTK